MLASYFPILVFIIVSLFLGLLALMIGRILGPHNPYAAKQETYECGFPSFGDARLPFEMRYYRIAILFIIFDLETIFLFPWAISFRQIGLQGLLTMGVFLGILLVGFIYEWKKGALEWV